jgi:hypothetical protein
LNLEWEDDVKFWLPLKSTDDSEGRVIYKDAGSVLVSVSVIPKPEAAKNPQGEGRTEPNSDPHLPQPEGRLKLSMNPFEMALQMIPPDMKKKLLVTLCLVACAALCAMMLPMILSNVIVQIL